MRNKALPFLRQVLGWGLTQGPQHLGLCRWPGYELPGALALQGPLRLALLARGPQQAATCIAEATFELVVGPRQARHVIAVEQAGPIAPADRVEVTTKRLLARRDIRPPPHCVEIAAELVQRRVQHAWVAWSRVLRCRRCRGARRRLGVTPGRSQHRTTKPTGGLDTTGRGAAHSAWPAGPE